MINIILVAILVIATIYYAFQTYRLVKENRKDKNVQQLENKLKHVYSPLLKLLEDAKDEKIQVGGEIMDKKEMISLSKDESEKIVNIYKYYRYLMSDKLVDNLSEFTKRVSVDHMFYEYDIYEVEELYSIVSEGYNVILISLDKLIDRG